MVDIHETLAARGAKYGLFEEHAKFSQGLIDVFERSPYWAEMKPDAKEALRVIANKVGRILNGPPGPQSGAEYDDSWRDIAGYATLVMDRILRDEAAKKEMDELLEMPVKFTPRLDKVDFPDEFAYREDAVAPTPSPAMVDTLGPLGRR